VEDEHRWLDDNENVEDYSEGEYREETGWGWRCTHCQKEWDLAGSLALEAEPRRSPIDSTPHDMAHDDWDRILGEIIGDLSAAFLVQVPGLYERLSQHFGHAIIEQWQEERGVDTDGISPPP